MKNKILYIAKKWGDERILDCTKEEWNEIFSKYSITNRHKAANLAAHNWDVILIDGRILISCAWSGGYWLNDDNSQTPLNAEEIEKFYPTVEKEKSRYILQNTYNDITRKYHQYQIVLGDLT